MNVARTRKSLWLTSGCLAAGAVVIAVVGLSMDLDQPAASDASAPADASNSAGGSGEDLPDVAAFEAIWDRDLQRPLYDPPKPGPTERPKVPLTVRLAGTVIEPGQSRAMFLTKKGNIELRAVGEMVEGDTELLEIHPDHVKVRHQGEEVTLQIEKQDETRRR